MYRSFNPFDITAKELFEAQLELIKSAFTMSTILLGNLNLDYTKKNDITYHNAPLFELFEQKLGALNLVQLVNFDTWSRLVGLTLRSSCLDHVYVKNLENVNNVTHLKPCFGDHELVLAELHITRPGPKM